MADLILQGDVQDLIDRGELVNGAPLINILGQVIVSLDDERTTPACNQLNTFINMVNSRVNSGSLSEANGDILIADANHIKDSIGCP